MIQDFVLRFDAKAALSLERRGLTLPLSESLDATAAQCGAPLEGCYMGTIRRELRLPVEDNTRQNDKRREFSRTIYKALSPESRRNIGKLMDAIK